MAVTVTVESDTGAARVLVVWCPDWPVVATAPEAAGTDRAVAVLESGRVLACSDEARAAGVRRGQRLRLAQRLCPELELRERDPEAETRLFEPVIAAVEAFTPRVEVLRPGMCAIPVKGPGRYFGGEEALAAQVHAAVAEALGRGAPQPASAGPADVSPPSPARGRVDEGAVAGVGGGRLAQVRPLPVHAGEGRSEEDRAACAVTPLHGAGSRAPDSAWSPPAERPAGPVPAVPATSATSAASASPVASLPGEPSKVGPRCRVGVADGLFAAVLAARAGVLVPEGRTGEFLAPYPVAALGDEPLAELLVRLGVHTVGDFAALSGRAVADRFGPTGTAALRRARGLQSRPLVPRSEGLDLTVEHRFDPPEPLAEPLIFVARTLAEQLHVRLASAGLTCQRVAVEVSCADGRTASRLWRHEGGLGASALAERARWQLQAWQSAGAFATAPSGDPDDPSSTGTAGFTALRLAPDDLVPDQGRQLALWGQAVAEDRVERAVARVQAVLGHAGLRRIEPAGGRGPAEQLARVPWGEAYEAPVPAPWPGRLQDPAPSVVPRSPLPVAVLDSGGLPVTVSGRAEVSAPPARLALDGGLFEITGWTGPWPAVEYWWDPERRRRRARFQITVADDRALVLTVEGGRWSVEAAYA
ncbi:DNA polymerase Y family protein [Kitasatospora sp. GP82]|uniref:DNA polymerase Y family protein n=1 Tax=Kitasatospora sp. GP82 TaxID=3035089 RepID=UPI002475A190|nr:DNA polymerase Y family protein [Kitasatospora sp. GP82]MDH6123814.1 protein ImuB [Kitasatospora sp. GP82]